MARCCAQKLEALGFEVRFDCSRAVTGSDTDQIIAFRKGAGRGRVALSAHMDCVQPCEGIELRVEDGVIRSAGDTILSSDDKAGVAQILEAIESLDESDSPAPDIWVLFSTCEELGCLGAGAYPDDLLPQGTLCLVMDADGPAGSIVVEAPWKWNFDAVFRGKSAHAGVDPEKGRSALQMAARAIELMPLGRHDEGTTSNIGTLEGGMARNVVAERCRLSGECRSLDEQKALELKDRIDGALEAGARKFGGTVEIDWHLQYPGFSFPEDDPDVRMLMEAACGVGLQPRLESTGGGSDANVLGEKGARALCLGTGMTDFHTPAEHISLADLQGAASLVEEVLAGSGRRS